MKMLNEPVDLPVQRLRFWHGFTLKRSIFFSGILLPVFWTAVANADASASANMTFTGSVVNRTCTPGWHDTITVPFNSVDQSSLPAHGSINSIYKVFTLSLTNCSSDVSKVKVTASGAVDPADANMWANSLDSGATGIGMYLMAEDEDGTALLADGRGQATFPVSSGAVDMKFKAYLEVDNDARTVTEGKFSVPVTLNINYE